jgi:uncharacterized protein (TIGR00251 family)
MIISVRVSPGAARDEITGFKEGVWQVRVKAPPVGGKANRALLGLLGKALGLAPGGLVIVKGQTSRHKTVAVNGLSEQDVRQRLSSFFGGTSR